ncbi:MAG: FHA domain-containing protein [Cytophagaceae bacterium]|nr:FHA domain-containing protein [Cytophagaceae bacterium]
MISFKNTLINCQYCGQAIMVKAADAERGEIVCKHPNCGKVNLLNMQTCYDPAITEGLPTFGQLTYAGRPDLVYPLRFGKNVIGTGSDCEVAVERFQHGGKCYISRRHCTLDVTFDKWRGQLRYLVQNGAFDPAVNQHRNSLNGTYLNEVLLKDTEQIDVSEGNSIRLGGNDQFLLETYRIPEPMLATYRVTSCFDADSTQ